MDERLPLGSADASTLRTLLEKERVHRQELEQEVLRLQAGVARQNQRITQLEQENADLRRLMGEQQQMMIGLQEQNALLRKQVALLEAENARLRETPRAPKPPPGAWPNERTKQDREERPRKKRDRKHNRGRHRMDHVDERVVHAAETCPRCGMQLAGGWEHRRLQVIELPTPVGVIVTEHVLLRRRCPICRHAVLPPVPGVAAGRIGRCRFGPRLLAEVATMATVERLPIRQIQQHLARRYRLYLSVGGIVGLLRQVALCGEPAYRTLQADARASPTVNADETGWRQDGIPGFIWILSTPTLCLFHRDPHRSGDVIDALLGDDFGGTLVTDFYAAYDHLPGLKQRCWAHLWRDIDALEHEYPQDMELAAWIAGIRAIYDLATGEQPAPEVSARARERRARRYEQQLLALCPQTMAATRPEATLAKRMRRYIADLFTFVRDPRVPPTNNEAERNLRPLVIARKISGGTRSEDGSSTRMILASLAATARLRGVDASATFLQVLHDPSHAF